MVVVYDSLTGQGKRFAHNLPIDKCVSVDEYDGNNEPLFLITRSYNFGEIPFETEVFLESHAGNIVGVAVSGNRNWGTNFGACGDKIQAQYGIELVHKFEGSGFNKDIEIVKQWLAERGYI